MRAPTRSEHRPVRLDVTSGVCAMGSCDHASGQCPQERVEACEPCTFDGLDLGNVDAVDVVRWPCGHKNPDVDAL